MVDLDANRRPSKAAVSQMPAYKLGLMNAFLFAAARRGDVHNVEHLLSNNTIKAQPNCVDDNLQSPLHVAVQRGQMDVAAVLIEYGTSFEQRDKNGITALEMASFLGMVKICKLLLRQGAMFSKRDKHGFTPLHYAAYNG
jgi:ankyrin repeat protein